MKIPVDRFVGFNPFQNIQAPQNLLIIAPDAFMQALQPLVEHKNRTYMPAIAVSISSLKPFFAGADDPEVIKNAIRYAHENLGTQYVMLVGDATFFPVRYMFIHVPPGPPALGTPGYGGDPSVAIPVAPDGIWHLSDLYYANLYHHGGTYPNFTTLTPDNWDSNGNGLYNEFSWIAQNQPAPNELTTGNPDNVDGYADVAVGRIPAHSAADVTTYVNKVILYEGPAGAPAPSSVNFTFVADHEYTTGDTMTTGMVANSGISGQANFNALAYLLIEDYVGAGGIPSGLPSPGPLVPVVPPAAPWQSAQPANVSSYASQSAWVSYVGHGGPHAWGYYGAFGESNVDQVGPTTALPVVFAAGCQTGQFAVNLPWGITYQDTSGTRHLLQSVPETMSGQTGPAIQDLITGQQWGTGCAPPAGCLPLPMNPPVPNPYSLDQGPDPCFSYPWLISSAPGGGIVYFGESCVAVDQMGVELETYILQGYAATAGPVLGDICIDPASRHTGQTTGMTQALGGMFIR